MGKLLVIHRVKTTMIHFKDYMGTILGKQYTFGDLWGTLYRTTKVHFLLLQGYTFSTTNVHF